MLAMGCEGQPTTSLPGSATPATPASTDSIPVTTATLPIAHGDGGAPTESPRVPTPVVVAGDDANPIKIATCCADVQGEAGRATPHQKLVYTAALQVCKTLMDTPAAGGGLISVRTLLRDVKLPASCQ